MYDRVCSDIAVTYPVLSCSNRVVSIKRQEREHIDKLSHTNTHTEFETRWEASSELRGATRATLG